MTDYENAYRELLADDTYRSLIDDYVHENISANVNKIYKHAYNTIYLNNSFISSPDSSKNPPKPGKGEELAGFLARHFRSRLSSIPYFKHQTIFQEKIFVEKNKQIAEREAGTYILDTLPFPKTKEIIYPYIQKTKIHNEAVFFFGDNTEQASTFLCRFYFNAKPDLFFTLLPDLSNRLESLDLPYTIKHFFLQDLRIDNTVIYVLPKYANLLYLALKDLYPTIRHLLNEPSPRFAKKLFDGIAFSECPHKGQSFGFHRCRMLSDYVLNTRERGEEMIDFRTSFAEHLVQNKINTERPYLNLHSNYQNYIFLHGID